MDVQELFALEQSLRKYASEKTVEGYCDSIIELMLKAIREDIALREKNSYGMFSAQMI